MRGGVILVLSLAVFPSLSPASAQAASFPCAKASTPTETAVCANAGLSTLDERLSAAYRDALKQLSGSGPEEGKAQSAVKADQKAWLAERNACGADPACLRTAYERRLKVLTFNPDPGAASPADRYVGVFDHGGFMGITAMALRNGQVAVSVSGAEPTAGRWVCDFSGLGRLDDAGRLVVGTPNANGDGLILEAKGKSGIDIPDNEPNQAAGMNWCGANGSFVFFYRRKS
ncbi:lysozyme inhibitor LprI family protein [Azospirillum sp. sgz302134]